MLNEFYLLIIPFLYFRSFKVQPLPLHMKPVGNKSVVASDSESAGPFIFSSLRGKVKQSKKGKSETLCFCCCCWWCCYIVDVVIVAVVVIVVVVVVIVVDVVTGFGVGTGSIVVGVVMMLIL